MKAIVLCAGKGTRLRPFTYSIPKPLIPICNVPVLGYVLSEIKKTEVKDVALIVNNEIKEPIEDYIYNNLNNYPFNFSFIIQPEPKGLAHACLMAKDFVGDDSFLMFLGDNIIPFCASEILTDNYSFQEEARILVKEISDPTPFGVVEFDSSGRVVGLEEKPKNPKSNFVILGVYIFKPNIFRIIETIKPSKRGELEITDAIQKLIEENKEVSAKIYSGTFIDIAGTEQLLYANEFVLRNMLNITNIVSPSSYIENSELLYNVSVGENCIIKNSTLKNSIIMDGTKLEGVKIEKSVIGRNCTIINRMPERKILTLEIGDNSTLEFY
ncbi:MAG: sugar phosphate nucleotidyltransferase [Caldisericia bacterium]|nr:sugar phosphate nucleotidyltransferase [Caldisericia bacterium]